LILLCCENKKLRNIENLFKSCMADIYRRDQTRDRDEEPQLEFHLKFIKYFTSNKIEFHHILSPFMKMIGLPFEDYSTIFELSLLSGGVTFASTESQHREDPFKIEAESILKHILSYSRFTLSQVKELLFQLLTASPALCRPSIRKKSLKF